jgi:hypothetical protein
MLEDEYTATKLPLRETLKSKVSGRAEDDAVLETSSRTVRAGWACGEGLVGTAALGLSSSVMADVRAVELAEIPDADEMSVFPADEADR